LSLRHPNRVDLDAARANKENGDDDDSIAAKILSLIAAQTGQQVALSDQLGSIGLSSIVISSLHASFLESFRVSEDAFPVELFF
jgi:hypothetical protein